MFYTRRWFFFFACLKDAVGAALTLKAAPGLSSDQQKNSLRRRPKSGGSGSATLVDCVSC